MTDRLRPAHRPAPLPDPLRWSITAWLAAVAFGVAETAVRLVLPDPPTAGELAARSVVYAVVAGAVLALASGVLLSGSPWPWWSAGSAPCR